MRVNKNSKIFILLLLIFLNFNCYSQILKLFDEMPIDTSKWSITKKINFDMDSDNIQDVILVFDKYKGINRPANIRTPVLFYKGTNKGTFSFITKAEKIIYSPYYDISISKEIFKINQKGVGQDYNEYSNLYKYQEGKIIMFKEIVVLKTEKATINEKTGDVSTKITRVDTIYSSTKNIPVEIYNFFSLTDIFNK